MKYFLLICLAACLFSCKGITREQLNSIILTDKNDKDVHTGTLAGNNLSIFLFMSPDCPLCVNYTKTISELNVQFQDSGVVFLIIYPGYFEKEEIDRFQKTYNLKVQGFTDRDLRLTKFLEATVTPQAIIISPEGEKIYSGAIDDRMFEIGRKKTIVSHEYLFNAITQQLKGDSPDPKVTEPIGCFIEL